MANTLAPFVITHEIKAPLQAVWSAWTDEAQLKQWWGPKSVDIVSLTNDFRVGGECRFHQRYENTDIRAKHVYHEIDPPNRIVFVGSFLDVNGETARNPFEQNFPLELMETIEFSGNDNRTQVRITWVPIGPTEAELQAFDRERDKCAQGWAGLFERLEEHLSTK